MDTSTLTFRVIDQLAESTDDLRPLAELARRLEPRAPDLVAAWREAAGAAQGEDEGARYNALARQLIALLRADDLRALYLWVAVQAESLALSGTEYDELLRMCESHYRAAMPVIAQAYEPGPELELALAALEDAYDAGMTILGSAYLQMIQERIMPGLRLQTVGRLATGMAHALNNLLAVIVGRAQVLRYTARDETTRHELDEIQNAALAAAKTIRQLQDFAFGTRETELTETDANQAVEEAIELTRFRWRDDAEKAGNLIDVARDLGDVPTVRATLGLLREIIVEVIFDAIASMPRGGIIGFRSERIGDQVALSISHTGDEPESGNARNDDSFAGIGLAQVRSLLAQLGGTLEVFRGGSMEDRSTVIAIRLPVADVLAMETGTAGDESEHGLRVLIVEDEPPIRNAIAQILSRQGHSVVVARSGAEGKRQVEERDPFDLILTDLGMAGVSSWEIAGTAKAQEPRTLVVLMTGWAADLDPDKLRASGIARVLQKPFDEKQLLQVLNEAKELKDKI